MTTKTVAARVKSTSDAGTGGFTAVISAPTLDRDGEVLDGGCFNPLPDRINVDIDHGMSVATTIGSGRPYYDGGNLMIDATFSSIPRAQEVRTLVTEGHIRGLSVTFMDATSAVKDGVRHITKAELLNVAVCPVPANREALVVSAKSRRRIRLVAVPRNPGGSIVGRQQDDELQVRAAAIRIRALAALAGVPLDGPSGRHFDPEEALRLMKTLKVRLEHQAEFEAECEAQRRPGAPNYATLAPGLPPVRCSIEQAADPSSTGAVTPTHDWANSTTEHNPDHDAFEFNPFSGSFVDERDPGRYR